ncbi:MAG TPA: glycosyltransferase family 2 protein [Burkholderiales bacterium]|nr:glycosyltransferase family 2 protein [Burkholderiales bacterium]
MPSRGRGTAKTPSRPTKMQDTERDRPPHAPAAAPTAPRRSISVVVPVYRSEHSLPELHRRIVVALEAAALTFEIILVEDGGGDSTWAAIQHLALFDARVRGIQLSRNYGQHNALLCGIRAARYDVVVTLDDDLQNPPEEIHKLLAALAGGFDVVYGAPARQQHGFLRNQASRLTKLALQGAMGAHTARHVSAFRAFDTRIRDAFDGYRSPFVSVDVLLTWGSSRFAHVSVRHDPRTIGESNYSLRKLVTHALNMMTGFTTIPLQLASIAGFSSSLFGLGVLAYVVGRYLIQGATVPGFAFLASVIAIFSGVQLFALGIIGEYLARMHLRTMDRPPYAVRSTTARAEPRPGAHPDVRHDATAASTDGL